MRIRWYHVALALLGLFAAWKVAGLLQSRSAESELGRLAREALEMARESRGQGGGGLALIALALGVAGPLLAAYLIHRLHAHEEAPPEEVLRHLDKEGLLDWDAHGHDGGMQSNGSPPQEGCSRRHEGPD
jgi:hypothetical protein